MNPWPRYKKPTAWLCGALALLGALLGWTVWDGLELGFWALWALPILYGLTMSRWETGALFGGYFLAAVATAGFAIARFYDPLIALLAWGVMAILLTLPWVLVRGGRNRGPWWVGGGYMVALLIVSVPPLGTIGIASPWLAATVSFPGMGLYGLLAALMVSGLLAAAAHYLRIQKMIGPLIDVGILWGTVSLVAWILYTPAHPPARWIPVTTHFRETVNLPSQATFIHQNMVLAQEARTLVARAPKGSVILFPEDVSFSWNPLMALIWRPVTLQAQGRQVTVAVGTYIATGHGQRYVDALLLLGARYGFVAARQPIPMTEWNPFAHQTSARATWGHLGPTRFFRKPVAVLLCYEQLLVWPIAESFMTETPPHLIVAASNHWWMAHGSTEDAMQDKTLRAWGQLYGVPVVLADNRASPIGAAKRDPRVGGPIHVLKKAASATRGRLAVDENLTIRADEIKSATSGRHAVDKRPGSPIGPKTALMGMG